MGDHESDVDYTTSDLSEACCQHFGTVNSDEFLQPNDWNRWRIVIWEHVLCPYALGQRTVPSFFGTMISASSAQAPVSQGKRE
jgi:hypothetical protein